MGWKPQCRPQHTPCTQPLKGRLETLRRAGLQCGGGGDLWDFMGANQKGQLILGTKMSHQAVPLTSKLSPQWGTVERPGPKASVGPTVRAMLLPVLSSSRPLTFLSVVGDGRG